MVSEVVNKFVRKCVEWAKTEKTRKEKAIIWIIVVVGATLLVVGMILFSKFLDSLFGIPILIQEPFNIIIGVALIFTVYPIAIWTFCVQHKIVKGTPMPHIPTKKLIVTGPFKYCRNPMSLGTIIFLAGLAVLFNSLFTLFIALIFTVILLVSIKIFEEKELEERFGQEYVEYKKKTPFLIPRPRRRKT